MNLFDQRTAVFSPCRLYRYRLEIRWDDGPAVNFCMLNPSKADEYANDPTVERCQTRARSMGYPALIVTNLFAWRDTDPSKMKLATDPIGPDNDAAILSACADSAITIAAWGKDGAFMNRAAAVRRLMGSRPLHYLRITTGEPWHPLYLPYAEQPKLWQLT